MKPRLSVNLDVVNQDPLSPQTLTFRGEGVSVGVDYFRLHGQLVSDVASQYISIQELIGKGAFSRVHKAEWTRGSDVEIVAVKETTIKTGMTSKERKKMLSQELKTLSRLQDRCLLKLFGAFVVDEKISIVLEYMDGGSLEDFLHLTSEGLVEATIAPIAYQILQGLSYLHREFIIHRDLKPSNTLLGLDGSVKLCDFGMASSGFENSLSTSVVGTTKYMAPERLRAEAYGRLSDVWSFGILLVECVLGQPPFLQVTSMVDLLVTAEETNYTTWIPNTTESGLKEIILGSLRVLPEQRIPSAVLLEAPWFDSHAIDDLAKARDKLKQHY